MSDYSSYSVADLERIKDAVVSALEALGCTQSIPCEECCVHDDCDALWQVRGNVFMELRKRRSKEVSHGEEKENRP